MTDSTPASVLVVDDDESVVDLFGKWLSDDYDVYTALNGRDALEIVEQEDIDVVLLDRRMPGLSGDDVLEAINERDIDTQVAMVTAVEPDIDIIEMGFDDYVVKPPTRKGIRETVENLLARRQHSNRRQEYWSLLAKRTALEGEQSTAELAENDEYAELVSRIETLAEELEEAHERMSGDVEFLSTLRDIESGTETDTET